MSSTSCPTGELDSKLRELQLLDAYLNCMALDIPMLNAAKSEREWDWFFHKLEEGFLVAEVNSSILKMKLAKRFMRGRQLYAWCDLMNEAVVQQASTETAGNGSSTDMYETIRDKMYLSFFPHSDYFNSLMELFGGYRENRNESPRRRMSLVGVKLVIGTAKETMLRVAQRYNRDMPPESFWYQFALRLMTPTVKELFDAKIAELTGCSTQATAAATTAVAAAAEEAAMTDENQDSENKATTDENKEVSTASAAGEVVPHKPDVHQVFPDMPIEQMLNSIRDPNARSMRAPHKFRRTIRKNRSHAAAAPGSGMSGNNPPTNVAAAASKKSVPVSVSSPSAKTNATASSVAGSSAAGFLASPATAATMLGSD